MIVKPEDAAFLMLKRVLPDIARGATPARSSYRGHVALEVDGLWLELPIRSAVILVTDLHADRDAFVSAAIRAAKISSRDLKAEFRDALVEIQQRLRRRHPSPQMLASLDVLRGAIGGQLALPDLAVCA